MPPDNPVDCREVASPLDDPYEDHVGLWARELRDWVPDRVFDAHVHLGPTEAMGALSAERRREALCCCPHLTVERLRDIYTNLYGGKRVVGLTAFPFPLREVDIETANRYIIDVMIASLKEKGQPGTAVPRGPRVVGFLLSHPTDVAPARAAFDAALARGVRFAGVKPYFDLLGKSNYETTMDEFIPEALLEFMDAEGLVMMLHTSGEGMGVTENQDCLRRVMDRYPRLRVILAHMGRYLRPEQFFDFLDSGLLDDCPRLFLEISSASRPEVYERTLERPGPRDRLLFGSDVPFGLIVGEEAWSAETGPVFLTRRRYPFTDPAAQERFCDRLPGLTYNAYHTLKALKDAMERMDWSPDEAARVRQNIFHDTAARLFSLARDGAT